MSKSDKLLIATALACAVGCALSVPLLVKQKNERDRAIVRQAISEAGVALDRNQRVLEGALADLESANETMQAITDYKPGAPSTVTVETPGASFTDDELAWGTSTAAVGTFTLATSSLLFVDEPSTRMLFNEDGSWEWTSADGAVVFSGTNTRVPLISEHTPCDHPDEVLGAFRICSPWRTVPPTESEMRAWLATQEEK